MKKSSKKTIGRYIKKSEPYRSPARLRVEGCMLSVYDSGRVLFIYLFHNGGCSVGVFKDDDINLTVGNSGFGYFDTGGVEVGFADDVVGNDVIDTGYESAFEFIGVSEFTGCFGYSELTVVVFGEFGEVAVEDNSGDAGCPDNCRATTDIELFGDSAGSSFIGFVDDELGGIEQSGLIVGRSFDNGFGVVVNRYVAFTEVESTEFTERNSLGGFEFAVED